MKIANREKMKQMNHSIKKLKLYYMDIAVKQPLLILLMVAVLFILLFILVKNTEFYEYTSQKASYNKEILCTDYNKHIEQLDVILFYTDKNVLVSKLKIEDIEVREEKMYITLVENDMLKGIGYSAEGYIDIPSKRVSILQKIFSE